MRHLILVVVALVAFSADASAGGANTVTLNPRGSFAGEYINLGDIASVKGPDARELGALHVMRAPSGTLPVDLSSEFVSDKIRSLCPGVGFAMNGSPVVLVRGRFARISPGDMENIYRDAVMKNHPWREKGRIVISDVRAPVNVRVPEKDQRCPQAKFSPGEDFLGLTTVFIAYGENPSETYRVTGKIKVMTEVPFVIRRISRGQVIREADLEMRSFDISSSPLVARDRGECLGMRAKTMLQPGKPIFTTNIEKPPVVSKGDVVAIEVRLNGLVVQDRGIALKDGLLNERIPVRNARSGRQVVGTIIAHSLVEVIL